MEFFDKSKYVEFCKVHGERDADILLDVVKRFGHSADTNTGWWPGKEDDDQT